MMEEPIVAIATGNVNAAIGIIRLSGAGVREEINKILNKPVKRSDDHRMVFRKIIINGEEYDQGMVAYFRAPKSYTGEDTIELYLHGNILNLKRILEQIIRHTKCRLAEPGEFTRRAFLNGKIDLTQAEAVAELISAQSERALQASIRHLEGNIREFLKEVRQRFIHIMSLLEIELDFAEEELEFVDRSEIRAEIIHVEHQLDKALESYRYGEYLNRGIKIAIIGKPNVGKSSLLNAILGRERAIVSDTPGTTRDFIEAGINVEGLLLNFIDTAGIRSTDEEIEKTGIEYSKKILDQCDGVILLFDGETGLDGEDEQLLELAENHSEKPFIFAINKTDVSNPDHIKIMIEQLKSKQITDDDIIDISALKKHHIDKLLKRIADKIIKQSKPDDETLIITSVRQAALIEQVLDDLNRIKQSIDQNMPSEMLSFDVRTAMEKIGEITGEITTDEILNHIFSSFCIGK